MIGIGYRKAENQYSERVVEKLYSAGSLIQVIQNTHSTGVPSTSNPQYSCLCKELEICGQIFALHKRDTQRIFIVNHDSVRASWLLQPDVQPHHTSHDIQTSITLSNNSEINLPDVSQNQSLDMFIPQFDSGHDRCCNHHSTFEIFGLLNIQVVQH